MLLATHKWRCSGVQVPCCAFSSVLYARIPAGVLMIPAFAVVGSVAYCKLRSLSSFVLLPITVPISASST